MPYIIAFVAASLIIASGVAFCVHTRQSLIDHIREAIREPENVAERTAELEEMLNQGMIPPDFGIEVSPPMMWKIQIADLLAGLWYIWVFLVLSACFAVAYFLAR